MNKESHIKILFDYQAFQFQKVGGISNCFVKLIQNMEGVDAKISIVQSENVHLRASGLMPNLSHEKLTYQYFLGFNFRGKGHLYEFLTDTFSCFPSVENVNRNNTIKDIINGDFDIYHPTFYSTFFLKYLGKKPFVATIHDMIPEKYPQYFGKNDIQKIVKPIYAKKAAHIIAVSEHTKNDIIEILKVPESKITVIHHGAPNVIDVDDKNLIGHPYFLFVGQRTMYKNFEKMIPQFADFIYRSGRKDIKLVCTSTPFKDKENELLTKYHIENNIIHITATDKDMINLYRHAIAFIYPSEYEGFGIPILEAYASSCLVLLAKYSCFPEIAGDAALYFDFEHEQNSLSHLLLKVINISIEEKNCLIDKQKERLKLYSWKKSALQLTDVYRQVLNK